MTFTLVPAKREKVGLFIGIAGASGSGKTYSAMRIASGISGDKPFAVIDTESRRALHYADQFKFYHGELHPPFTPESYLEAIKVAVDAKYPVIVVDSASHVWEGEGGVSDVHDEELDRMAGQDFKKREKCDQVAWARSKKPLKKMMASIVQMNIMLIMCFRADQKVGIEKDRNGKTVIVDKGWQPICEKRMPYEMTASFMLTPDKPGFIQSLKLQEQHKALFPADKQLNEESGRLIAEWASGGTSEAPEQAETDGQPEQEDTGDNTAFYNVVLTQRERVGDVAYFKALGGRGYENLEDLIVRDDQIAFYNELLALPDKK